MSELGANVRAFLSLAWNTALCHEEFFCADVLAMRKLMNTLSGNGAHFWAQALAPSVGVDGTPWRYTLHNESRVCIPCPGWILLSMNAQSLFLRNEYSSKNFCHVQQLFDRRTEACIRVKSALCIRKYMGRKVHNFCLSNVPTLFFCVWY